MVIGSQYRGELESGSFAGALEAPAAQVFLRAARKLSCLCAPRCDLGALSGIIKRLKIQFASVDLHMDAISFEARVLPTGTRRN